MQCMKRCFIGVFAMILLAGAVGAITATHLSGWLVDEDSRQKGAAIVLLGGDPSRALEAAELYRSGLAPRIYVSVPRKHPGVRRIEQAGLSIPSDEELTRQVLVGRGVPESAIAILSRNMASTAHEAKVIREQLASVPGVLLIVTSPFHTYRAGLIMKAQLGEPRVKMIGSRFEPLPEEWWRDGAASGNVLMETTKLVYWSLIGRFLNG
jgi:uncharacterized SAM-binding protein YcdF (DUF218 family)